MSLIYGSKMGNSKTDPSENMLENCGGTQGVGDGEERLGEWKQGKELGDYCGKRQDWGGKGSINRFNKEEV